jgi:hypothetical protein
MFRVRWRRSALNELAEAWLQANATLRQAITAATGQVDQRLREDPRHEGESRPRGRRIMFVAPLAVTFRIERDGQMVSVLHARVFNQR